MLACVRYVKVVGTNLFEQEAKRKAKEKTAGYGVDTWNTMQTNKLASFVGKG